MRVGKIGQLIIDKKVELMKEIKITLPFSTIHLIGPSGSGKTELVENLIKDKSLGIDEIKIVRLQGVSSEDFRIPVVKTIKKENGTGIMGEVTYKDDVTVELVNLGIFQDILDNPEKRFLVYFDEITRCDPTVAPLLFGLLERRINGIPVKNMWTICSSNFNGDDNYINNIDFKDSALRRRQVFIEYIPSQEDIVNFAYEHNYHPILTEALEVLNYDAIICHTTTKELEQDTQLGSWAGINHRWKTKGIKTYKEANLDAQLAGCLYLNHSSKQALTEKLALFEQIAQIDIQKEIIENHNLDEGKVLLTKNGEEYRKEGRLMELKIRTKTFVVNELLMDNTYLEKNIKNLFHVFAEDAILFLALMNDYCTRYENLKTKKVKTFNPKLYFATQIVNYKKNPAITEKEQSLIDRFISDVSLVDVGIK